MNYPIRVSPDFEHFFDLWQKQKAGTLAPAEEEELREMLNKASAPAAKSKAAGVSGARAMRAKTT